MNEKNFQKITSYTCNNCEKSIILYDPHHDMMFCKNCGTVLYQSAILFMETIKE